MTVAATAAQPAPGPARRLPAAIIAAFSTPGIPLGGLLLVLAVYVPRFYVGLGLPFIAVAFTVLIVRLLDISLDPILGVVMDRTRTPIGRYRPWLLLGAPIIIAGTFMLLPKASASVPALALWMFVAYAGYSVLNLALSAWSTNIAPTYDERSRLWGWTQGVAVTGSVALLLLPLFTHGRVVLGKGASMPLVGWLLIAAFPTAVVICALFTPDRIGPTPQRYGLKDWWSAISRPTMRRLMGADLLLTLGPGTTAPLYVYFFHDAKGFNIRDVGFLLIFYIGAGLVGAPFWGRQAHRFGKHRTLQIACVCYAVTQTILMILPRVWPGYTLLQALPTAIGMTAVGFCASAFLLLVRAMVSDVADEVRLEQGRNLTSLLFSMVTTTSKIGVAITVTVVFPILQMAGYNGREGAVNTPHAIFVLEMCYLFAPIILVFFGGSLFFGYKLDARRHGAIREALARRDDELEPAAAEETLTGAIADGEVAAASQG
ncbi:MAG TPA: MFS transporter [Caulobacteraceae bacterium]|nr:MFS transporter [Caulobacteraceae bacterium]